MSFLKRLFTGGGYEGHREKADELLAEGDFGSAKLSYDRALDKAPQEARAEVEEHIATCCDGISDRRVDEALRLREQGQLDMAKEELAGALEVVRGTEARARAQGLSDEIESADAIVQAEEARASTDEELLVLVTSQWTEAQADEFNELGDELLDAIVHVQRDRYAEARELLEAMLGARNQEVEDAEGDDDDDDDDEVDGGPCYLLLEVAKARLLTQDLEGAKDAFEGFLAALDEDEGGDAQLATYGELARIADDAGDFDGAMAHYQTALETFPDDYRPYLLMGAFLRMKDSHEEAIEILEAASEMMDDIRPDWRVFQELGYACAALERNVEAIDHLELVVGFFTGRGQLDVPVDPVMKLAALHETSGKPDRAADLYAVLSRGSDKRGHALYHYEAGRVLGDLGLDSEAHRMLTRASALVGEDEELGAKIDERLSSLAGEG